MKAFFAFIAMLWHRVELFCCEHLLIKMNNAHVIHLLRGVDIVANGKRWIGKNLAVDHVAEETVVSECDDYWAYRCLCRTANGAFAEIYLEEFDVPVIIELSSDEYSHRLQSRTNPHFYAEA